MARGSVFGVLTMDAAFAGINPSSSAWRSTREATWWVSWTVLAPTPPAVRSAMSVRRSVGRMVRTRPGGTPQTSPGPPIPGGCLGGARGTIQVPAIRDTFKLVQAGVREGESGACDQVLHRLRDEDL